MVGHSTFSDNELLREARSRVTLEPKDATSLVLLGALLFEPFHRPEEAARYLREAIERDPNNIDARFWLAKILVHEYVDEKGAKGIVNEALRLDPNRADCLSLMASIVQSLGGCPEDYVPYLERAVEQAPDWPALHVALAQALFDLGEFGRAETEAHVALPLFGAEVVPRGPVEEYYETVVTGRLSPTYQQLSESLLDQIRRQKTRHALYEPWRRKDVGSS